MGLPARVRRVFIIHTAEQLPVGPFAGGIPGGACSVREHRLLHEVDGIWAVSNAIKEYATMHGNYNTKVLYHHPWNYLVGDAHALPRRRYNWDKKTVLMVNPCYVKGSDILIGVARQCPDIHFLVLSSWGVDINPEILKDLEKLPNLELAYTFILSFILL